MHISEGVLSIPVLSAGALITVAGLAIGIKKVKPADIPKVALTTSAFFVASLVHIPIGPSNAHLVLNGFLGVLLGWAAFPAIFIGLVLQAVLFQFGGLTTLGVNSANIALPGIFFGLLARRFITLKRPNLSALIAGLAGGLSVMGSGLMVALSLSLSGDSFTLVSRLIFSAHIPIAVVEGIITGFVTRFLLRVRPEIVGCNLSGFQMKAYGNAALLLLITTFSISLLAPPIVEAHRVSVFAWYDGKVVVGKAYYANGKPAKHAKILVHKEEQPSHILTVESDEFGRFSFTPSSHGEYVIELVAGLGHKATTVVKVGKVKKGQKAVLDVKEPQKAVAPTGSVGNILEINVSCKKIEQLLEKVLERHLAPVRDELEKLEVAQSRVTFKDVVSGIGYIMGIMGLWAYMSSNRKS